MKTKLYILWAKGTTDYDHQAGVVVEAVDSRQARKLASETAGMEGAKTWLSAKGSTCEQLKLTGEPKSIIQDFRAG